MTIPYQRTRALIQTQQFLQSLEQTPAVPQVVRDRAKELRAHFPSYADIEGASGPARCVGPCAPV
jgi:hypothetical protein